MGCGVGGSYLYSLLTRKKPEVEVSIFDIPHHTRCGIKGCAWGVSSSQFMDLCQEAHINPHKYILGVYDHVLLDQSNLRVAYRYASADKVKLKAKVAMIDKPLFIEDMLDEVHPLNPSEANLTTFDRIIDATGFKRAYLSPYPSPLIINTIQIRAAIEPPSFPTAIINKGGGYTWVFPIGKSEAHVGSVSLQGIEFTKRVLDELTKKINVDRIICSCEEQIRGHGPVVPFIEGKVWGLGEAIGLVDPISGAGILPAMTSAKLLLENWDNPRRYESHVRAKYSYITREVNILSKFCERRLPGYQELFPLWSTFRNTGISIGPREIINILALASRVRKGGAEGFFH